MLAFLFPIVDTCLSCEDIARQICAMVPRWRFLGPAFLASCMQHVSDLHSKFALARATPLCISMVDIQSPTAEIRRGKERKKKKEGRNHRAVILHTAAIKKTKSTMITTVLYTSCYEVYIHHTLAVILHHHDVHFKFN